MVVKKSRPVLVRPNQFQRKLILQVIREKSLLVQCRMTNRLKKSFTLDPEVILVLEVDLTEKVTRKGPVLHTLSMYILKIKICV